MEVQSLRPSARFTSFLRNFRNKTDGSATVEAVLWLPLFVVFFVMVADVSFAFHRQSQIMRIVQDGNRAISVGRIVNQAELETYIATRLASFTSNAAVTSVIDTGTITTQVRVPIEDLVAVGMLNFLSGYSVGVTNHQFIEY